MNFTKTAIFITLISLWLTNYFTGEGQQMLAFVLIFSIGILHGSNDLALVQKINKQKVPRWNSSVTTLATYVLVVVLASVLFYVLPWVALGAFILFSGFHFGEQHWSDKWKAAKRYSGVLLYLCYGLLVLFGLFYLNANETTAIISSLTGIAPGRDLYLYGLASCGTGFLLLMAQGYRGGLISFYTILMELFILAVFGIVFNYADLIWAFAIYFIYWHSIPSIVEQLNYLYGQATPGSFLRYLRSSSLIWISSTAFMLLVFYYFRNEEDFILPLFFAFLGAITFAHSLIINRMFASKGE